MKAALNAAILAAHAADDRPALITYYRQAADLQTGPDARAYFLTVAYIYALEAGDPQAAALKARLSAMGREP